VKARAAADSLPEHLRTTCEMLQDAFPQGIAPNAYLPLLALLGEELSDRNLADVIARAFGMDSALALNDIYRARSTDAPSEEVVENLKRVLLLHGYDKWRNEH
jgi:hypothetical protein